MLAGGAEELCPSEAIAFDFLFATSRRNDRPTTTPRPFDRDRDGLVIGEGAAHVRARGPRPRARARARASTRRSSASPATPTARMSPGRWKAPWRGVMELALADAGIPPGAIGYVNAHGTATEHGDIAETRATVGDCSAIAIPISSQKSYLGHTLGACGAIEAWFTVEMMKGGWYAPTLNLDNVDPAAATSTTSRAAAANSTSSTP